MIKSFAEIVFWPVPGIVWLFKKRSIFKGIRFLAISVFGVWGLSALMAILFHYSLWRTSVAGFGIAYILGCMAVIVRIEDRTGY